KQERRRYEKEYPNDTWQADTTYGPYIVVNGKKYRTYLIHFIDDNSRLIVGYGFYYRDSGENVQKVFKKAIEKYGIPKQIYVDNGKSYKNKQLEIICARLGVKLTHTHAYDPEAKGKVERCFKTIKEGWMYDRDWNKFNSIEELEKDYSEYLYNEYQNKEHRELKDTPNNVWHRGIEDTVYKRIDSKKLEEIFMHTIKRKVSSDRTISINKKLYEVPYKYILQEIELRYYITKEEEIWIYENGERKEKCVSLDKVSNSKVKRKVNIDYSKMINNEEDVIEKEEE
ncbi:MAG: DDE-type integrase/transposase/recombinase, partial [Bacilli bacterium]